MKKLMLVQKITIGMIVICFIVVVGYLIFALINRPENQVKGKIADLAAEYYEDYLYPDFSQTSEFQEDAASVMEKYRDLGFSSISLRQLLLYDDKKNQPYAEWLNSYCDEDQTLIKFYPEAPYGAKNYHIQYTYSCEFGT